MCLHVLYHYIASTVVYSLSPEWSDGTLGRTDKDEDSTVDLGHTGQDEGSQAPSHLHRESCRQVLAEGALAGSSQHTSASVAQAVVLPQGAKVAVRRQPVVQLVLRPKAKTSGPAGHCRA